MFTSFPTERSKAFTDRVEAFVREVVAPNERGPRNTGHGQTDDLVRELRAFRIYEGSTEGHKWSLAMMIKRKTLNGEASHG